MSGTKASPTKPAASNLNLKVSKRVLAAPTPTTVANCSRSPYNATGIPHINYTNFKFKPLEPYNELTYDRYCGPTPESNWVLPGVMLVGAYPASNDDNETFDLISSILLLGITKFVCLQKEVSQGPMLYCVCVFDLPCCLSVGADAVAVCSCLVGLAR
jgi:hypothetical protein